MIVVMQEQAPEAAIEATIAYLVKAGCSVQRSSGQTRTILGLVGDVSVDDLAVVRELEGVAQVVRVSEPFHLASSRFRQAPTLLQGDYGTIGGNEPWIALEPVPHNADHAPSAGSTGEESAPVSASLPYRIAAGRPFDAAIARQAVAPNAVGALACVSIHSAPREARHPLLFVTRMPSWGVEPWLMRAESELQRGGLGVVLLEAGGECPGGERSFDAVSLARTKARTHLPIVVDVPTIAGQVQWVSAVACAAIAAGADGVVLRVCVATAGERPRVPATLSWDAAVDLAERLRAIGRAVRA
ncbi:MAG TPA: hypothetical protein VL137_09200 [Polyangiaceae bacterium]|nr:hypothetical protein [Polyangiaceae bacterium]